jgi:DNA-directed RNA polymerase specialized sigma24 family protein
LGELRLLEQLINSLPDEDRIIFVLHDIEGYDYSEIEKYLPDLSADELKTKLIIHAVI